MRLAANRITLNVVDTGSGPAILLLHGFPDSAALWRHQIPALTDAGYRVIAPDLRGFGESDRPDGVANYAMPTLVGDVLAVLDALGVAHAAVVGHDWGAALGWAMAALAADRVDRLAALSLGHPSGFLTDAIRQRERSWYMLFFQFVDVAEEALARDDWALLRSWLREPSDLERYLADLGRPGALTAALNWYRANITPEAFGRPDLLPLPPAGCPVLGIWSSGDHFCGEAQMLASHQHVSGSWRYERIEGASHWIPLDAPGQVSELLIEFLRSD